jgi:hypothetical protein
MKPATIPCFTRDIMRKAPPNAICLLTTQGEAYAVRRSTG